MNHLDMCSGIGGWALAFRELGINTIGFCEIDKYPQQVLKKNFPNIPIFNDLKELTYEQIKERTGTRDIDIVTCSYPCQPFSVAGKQKGEEDSRHLWPDTFRIIQESKPTWFVGENVGGHIKLGLDTVLEDLASIGYDTRTFVIPASSLGAWHQRKRIWIIGHKAVSDTSSEGLQGHNSKSSINEPQLGQSTNHDDERRTSEGVCNPDSRRFKSSESKTEQETGLSESSKRRAEQENWWQTQSELCGVPDGVSYGLDKGRVGRIKGLGNAIVPQIAWHIGNAILQANGESK
jgi:DNA (cytosine-5)-methyltransferase 1